MKNNKFFNAKTSKIIFWHGCGFCGIKIIVSMKKIIVVLPFCAVFAFCSSSKKAATPVAPGISNVNVSRNDTMTSATNASASLTAADRDWAYSAKHDTTLNGTWILEGMVGSDGNWTSTQTTNTDTTSTATANVTDTAMVVTPDTTTNTSATTASATTTGKRGKGKNKINRKALYDSAQARLNLDYKSTTTLDTTAEAYKYWTRTPSVTLNATNLIFTGTTGCNSMSGSFNFSNKEIQFGRNIVTSKMSCNEYDETKFISALKKADNYTLNGNTLELKQGNTRLLSFKKA